MTKSAIIIIGRYKLKLYNKSQVRPLHTNLMKTNIVHQAYKKKKKKFIKAEDNTCWNWEWAREKLLKLIVYYTNKFIIIINYKNQLHFSKNKNQLHGEDWGGLRHKFWYLSCHLPISVLAPFILLISCKFYFRFTILNVC